MAYQQNKDNNNKYYSKPFKQQDRPRNKNMTFDIRLSGTTANGRDYQIQSAIDLLEDLTNFKVFSKMSIPIQISRAILESNPEMRGNLNVGYVKDLNVKDYLADIVIYSTFADKIDSIKGLQVAPRMIVDREQNAVTILGFDLIKG